MTSYSGGDHPMSTINTCCKVINFIQVLLDKMCR